MYPTSIPPTDCGGARRGRSAKGRRVWIVIGALFVAQGLFVWYDNRTDDWFARNERFTIGLPFAPWFEYRDWSNPIEGGGGFEVRFLTLTVGLFVIGILMLREMWITKDHAAELEAEKRANVDQPPPTEV